MKLLVLLSVLGLSLAQVDRTMLPGEKGSAVVETVVSRITASCVFPDDKLFLRRLAYVESVDGTSANAYRTGYYGGIWQVDESMFQAIAQATVLPDEKTAIKTQFGIDWNTLTWNDLKVPMHSGIGAALFLLANAQQNNTIDIARDIDGQANFWIVHYRPAQTSPTFVNAVINLEQGCTTLNSPDLVFVLDASGSVGSTNFDEMRRFVNEVIDGFTIGSDDTRVAVIRYATNVDVEFHLNAYSTKADVQNAVTSVLYTAGGTNTHLALDALIDTVLTEANGARPLKQGRPRVAIIVTDGQSNNQPATVTAANRVHSRDITMITIGVTQNVDMDELKAMASTPTCQHLFLLRDFSEVAALSAAIEQRTCDAPVIYNPIDNCTGVSISVDAGFSFNCMIRIPAGGATLKLGTANGGSKMYLADDTFPNSAYFSETVTAAPDMGKDALYISGSGTDREVFCYFEGDVTISIEFNVCVQPGDRDYCGSDPCQNGGTCLDNGNGYSCICPTMFTGANCETNLDWCRSNPCLNGGTCINEPDRYVCECDTAWKGDNCETKRNHDCGANNPCIQENRDIGMYHFLGPVDTQFVQCDAWGGCWVKDCPAPLVWDTTADACNWAP